MGAFIQVVTTIDSRDAAERIARLLIEERLAVCVQIEGPMTSIYRWQGRVEESKEWRLTAKSRAGLFEAIVTAVRSVHSYEVPEIIATMIDRVDEAYSQWLEEEIRPEGDSR